MRPPEDQVRALLGAVAFLTRAPVGRRAPSDLTLAAPWFPLVGAALGGLVAGTAALLALVVPPLAAAGIALAVEAVVTGALHLDGLADSADGLAGRDREHALAIMADHAIGAYGTCALVIDLLIKAAALSALASAGAAAEIVAAYAVSRAAALPLAAALGPARPGPGAGRLLAGRIGGRTAATGVLVAAAIAAATGWSAAAAAAGMAAVVAAVGLAARRRLGGVTGDTLGAAIELTATLGLVVAAGLAV